MGSVGIWGFVIIGLIVLLVFGTSRFGRTFKGLKTGGRALKRGVSGEDDPPPPPAP